MIFELIYKYLNNEASEEEVSAVFEWIEASKENKDQFIAFKKTWAISATDESAKRSAWKLIEKELSKSKKRKPFELWKYAAILIILIGLGKMISIIKKPESTISNEVVLELENGDLNYIIETPEKNLLDNTGNIIGKQHPNEIIYQTKVFFNIV